MPRSTRTLAVSQQRTDQLSEEVALWHELGTRVEQHDPTVKADLEAGIARLQRLVLNIEMAGLVEPDLSEELHRIYRVGVDAAVRYTSIHNYPRACHVAAHVLQLIVLETGWMGSRVLRGLPTRTQEDRC